MDDALGGMMISNLCRNIPADLSQLRQPVAPLPRVESTTAALVADPTRARREGGADGQLFAIHDQSLVVAVCFTYPPNTFPRTMSSTTRRRSSASATAPPPPGRERESAASKKR